MINSIKKRGFSLLEVLIASSIFMVFATSIISLITLNSKNAVVNKHRLEAANLARRQIEQLRQIKSTNQLNGRGALENVPENTTFHIDDSGNIVNGVGSDGTIYTIKVEVE